MAAYEPEQRVQVRTFLPPPEWEPAVIKCQLPNGMYEVERTFPDGGKATTLRRADEIRPGNGGEVFNAT